VPIANPRKQQRRENDCPRREDVLASEVPIQPSGERGKSPDNEGAVRMLFLSLECCS
jgi:hypothetical protein